MAVDCEGKTRNVSISPREHQDGRFQPVEDTLRIVLRKSLAFGVDPYQTNKHSQLYIFNLMYSMYCIYLSYLYVLRMYISLLLSPLNNMIRWRETCRCGWEICTHCIHITWSVTLQHDFMSLLFCYNSVCHSLPLLSANVYESLLLLP